MKKKVGNNQVVFNMVLYPYRSLNLVGFWFLMGIIILLSFIVGGFFYSLGAWPVVGFFGFDILLIYIGFKISYKTVDCTETITLTEEKLLICKKTIFGKSRFWSFSPPHWVRVTIKENDQYNKRIILSSHGSALYIGDFLLLNEKYEVASSIRMAISGLVRIKQI